MSELRYVIDICGLEEEIRCTICENPMHTDKGCDGNCKYNEKAFKRITDLLDKRIELLPIAPEPHWIPVEQALPKENYLDDGYVEPSQPVLVYMNYHCYKISRYWGHRKTKGTSGYVIPDWMDLEDHDGNNVLAWCELPERYKGVTE